MRGFIEAAVSWPLPAFYLMLAGLLLWRRPIASRRLLAAGVGLLLVFSTTLAGKILAIPLIGWAGLSADDARLHLIVVPTAGIYSDETGGWWAGATSLRRLAVARRAQARLGLPIALIGGSPVAGQPAEAAIVARDGGFGGDGVIIETGPVNSVETARAVARQLAGEPHPRVLLVTSAIHQRRMASVLRNAGVGVMGLPVGLRALDIDGWDDVVPGFAGLALNRDVMHEYLGIAWYLLTGRLGLADLPASGV